MTAKNPRSHLKIIISDDGCGMDEELVKEINSAILKSPRNPILESAIFVRG